MKNRLVGVESFNVDRQTDGLDETNSRFFAIFANAPKSNAVVIINVKKRRAWEGMCGITENTCLTLTDIYCLQIEWVIDIFPPTVFCVVKLS